ncbi:YeiH family protein [Planococcus lenghuensis]|uniref:YeiH family protein n=1 Tax=Planococcus lenghuensis TaxID=2213202 RepID=UPI001E2AC24C|nr:putative sulfate exporter family transporter [Planococcus lenghuensis]
MGRLRNCQEIAPGLFLCLLLMLAGIFGAEALGVLLKTTGVLPEDGVNPVSEIFIIILLGILIRNTIGLNSRFVKGVTFSVQMVLKAGIVLLGLRLSLLEALALGAWGIPLIIACISVALGVTLFCTKKLGQSARLGTLIASGTSICGLTAIMATAPVIKAKENEVAYAVANITIFGLTGMLIYPYIIVFFFSDDPVKAGLFLGTAIHDTAQVTGAALIYGDLINSAQVVDVATVTKLIRNLFLIAVIPFVSVLLWKRDKESAVLPKWHQLVPLFIIGFFAMALLRTIGDATATASGEAFGLLAPGTWEQAAVAVSTFGSTYLFGIAMAGIGLSTSFNVFKGLGMKPFAIGFTAAFAVGAVSLVLISVFGDFIAV